MPDTRPTAAGHDPWRWSRLGSDVESHEYNGRDQYEEAYGGRNISRRSKGRPGDYQSGEPQDREHDSSCNEVWETGMQWKQPATYQRHADNENQPCLETPLVRLLKHTSDDYE